MTFFQGDGSLGSRGMIGSSRVSSGSMSSRERSMNYLRNMCFLCQDEVSPSSDTAPGALHRCLSRRAANQVSPFYLENSHGRILPRQWIICPLHIV